MKHCPKCSRTFPDESQKFCTVDGGVLIGEATPDPNLTLRASEADLQMLMPQPRRNKPPKSQKPSDPGKTLYAPAGSPPPDPATSSAPSRPPVAPVQPVPSPSAPIPQRKKRSLLPWIIGGLLLFLLLGLGGAAAIFFYFVKPRVAEFLDRSAVARRDDTVRVGNRGTTVDNTGETDAFVPPPDAVKFTNSRDSLDGKLAENYVDFSFYYPESWQSDANAGVAGSSNFVKVERMLPPDVTQENFAVGWYTSRGSFDMDQPTFPQLVELLGSTLSRSFPEYRKVSEGPTTVNSLKGYEFRFVSSSTGTEKGDVDVWGRVIFLPTGIPGQRAGATLIMLGTSLAPELSGVEDVGEKGEMPIILESFRLGNKN